MRVNRKSPSCPAAQAASCRIQATSFLEAGPHAVGPLRLGVHAPPRPDPAGELPDGKGSGHDVRRDLQSQPPLQLRHQRHRLQGVAAERQQVVVGRGVGAAHDGFKCRGHGVEQVVMGPIDVAQDPLRIETVDRRPVRLEIGQPRQLGLDEDQRGHEVPRQGARGHGQDVAGKQASPLRPKLDIGDHGAGDARLVPPDHRDGLAHAGASAQGGLGLRRLDPMAPQLDQLVLASDELEEPVGSPQSHVAGLERPDGRVLRVGREPLGRQPLVSPVAQGEIAARHHELAHFPIRQRPPLFVDHLHRNALHPPTDWHPRAGLAHSLVHPPVGVGRGDFGRAQADPEQGLRGTLV